MTGRRQVVPDPPSLEYRRRARHVPPRKQRPVVHRERAEAVLEAEECRDEEHRIDPRVTSAAAGTDIGDGRQHEQQGCARPHYPLTIHRVQTSKRNQEKREGQRRGSGDPRPDWSLASIDRHSGVGVEPPPRDGPVHDRRLNADSASRMPSVQCSIVQSSTRRFVLVRDRFACSFMHRCITRDSAATSPTDTM